MRPVTEKRRRSAAEADAPTISVNVRFTKKVVERLDALAASEERTRASMAAVLIKEAMKARGVPIEPAVV